MKTKNRLLIVTIVLVLLFCLTGCGVSKEELEMRFQVGNYVTFGLYPQESAGTDNTPIEWLVLARDGDKAFLISRYALDVQPYNNGPLYADITWEECSLRAWLNNDFLNRAFTAREQNAIETTLVDNTRSQCFPNWDTEGGNITKDKVFLLSYKEADRYFEAPQRFYWDENDRNKKAEVKPTNYAISKKAKVDANFSTCAWWLRSPGFTQDYAACIMPVGLLNCIDAVEDTFSIRPAIWVNLASGVF